MYRQQLGMMNELCIKLPKPVGKKEWPLFSDSVRYQTRKMTVMKIQLEVFCNLPDFPGAAVADYHFFQNIDSFLIGKLSKFQNDVKMPFRTYRTQTFIATE